MPGSVANAVVASGDVMPAVLCPAFAEVRDCPILLVNQYHDGSSQRSLLSQTSRKRWQLTARLRAVRHEGESLSPLEILSVFYQAHGTIVAFYFYNPCEPASGMPFGSNYDPTGVSAVGRYKVVFRGDWQQTVGMAFAEVPLGLQEVV